MPRTDLPSIPSKPADGALRVHPGNSRYFTDDSGKAIYMTGSHVWWNIVGKGDRNVPYSDADFEAFLDYIESFGHNFTRIWVGFAYPTYSAYPWQRTGPGNAADGKPKFDLLKTGPADWISPSAKDGRYDYRRGGPAAYRDKIVISDVDHLWAVATDDTWLAIRKWVWQTFTRGNHPILMDQYNSYAPKWGAYGEINPKWDPIKWFNPQTGKMVTGGSVNGGDNRTSRAKSDAELALWLDAKLVMHVVKGIPHGPWSGMGFDVLTTGGETFEGLRLRADNTLKINHLWLEHYVDEGAQRQNRLGKPNRVNRVWFDDIVVATRYVGPIAARR